MTTNHATVTVAVPVYNGERYLAETLDSIRCQTVAPTEALVFDNCSTDRTREVTSSILSPEAVRSSGRNLGAVANFNRAVEESTGTYFAWLAADDRLAPRFVEATVAALESSSASVCLPAIQFIDPDGNPLRIQRDPALASRDARTRLRSYLRRLRWTEVYCLYRREALLASPMFRNDYGPDVLLMWWFLLRQPLLVLDEPLVEYRLYPKKSADDVAESLSSEAPVRRRWLMVGLWRTLWQDAAAEGVDPEVTRVARAELIRCLYHRAWIQHIVWDIWLRVQDTGRAVRRRLGPRQ